MKYGGCLVLFAVGLVVVFTGAYIVLTEQEIQATRAFVESSFLLLS